MKVGESSVSLLRVTPNTCPRRVANKPICAHAPAPHKDQVSRESCVHNGAARSFFTPTGAGLVWPWSESGPHPDRSSLHTDAKGNQEKTRLHRTKQGPIKVPSCAHDMRPPRVDWANGNAGYANATPKSAGSLIRIESSAKSALRPCEKAQPSARS